MGLKNKEKLKLEKKFVKNPKKFTIPTRSLLLTRQKIFKRNLNAEKTSNLF
jgi:hypothetical protein